MGDAVKSIRGLVDLIPLEILRDIASFPVVEAGFGAGPGFMAMKRWEYVPPTSLLEAVFDLEKHRDRMRRCHIAFLDGSRLTLDRNKFLSFKPSIALRSKNANRVDSDGVIKERFRFDDFEEWSDTLASDIAIFSKIHRIMPNLLAASKEVYIEIDLAAMPHRELVTDGDGRHPREDEDFEVSMFRANGCEVGFVVMDNIGFPEYLLMFDPNPDDDGELFIIPGTCVSVKMRKAG